MVKPVKKNKKAEGAGTAESSLPVLHLIEALKSFAYFEDYVVGRDMGPVEFSKTDTGTRITIDLGERE